MNPLSTNNAVPSEPVSAQPSTPNEVVPTREALTMSCRARAASARLSTWVKSIMVAGAVGAPLAGVSFAADDSADKTLELPEFTVEEQNVGDLSSPKFTAPLEETPQSIVVIPNAVFDEQGVSTLRDVLRNTPGITFQAGEGGTPAGDQMTIRGFSARTDMFIDGVRDLGGYSRDTFNLEQVEVSKGPSSSISGRGSTGGAVNQVSKTPKSVAFKSAAATVGSEDYKRVTLDVNQPLTSEKGTAVRLNAMWTDGGVVGRDVVENSSWGIAPSLAFGLGKPTRFTFSYLHLEQDNVPDYGLPWAAFQADPPVDQTNFYGLKQRDYEKIDNNVVSAELVHDFGESLTLRNLTRYGETVRDSVITAPRILSGTTDVVRRTDWKSRDQSDEIWANLTNLNAYFDTGSIRHSVSAGLEFTRESEINYSRDFDPDLPDPPGTDLYEPNPDDDYDGVIARTGGYNEGEGDTVALYAFDTIELGEKWQFRGGLRWDSFDAEYRTVDDDGVATVYSREDKTVSWNAGGVYSPWENGNFYFGVGTSFNPSAENLSLASRRTNLEDVPPEKTVNYEVGTKWNLFDNRLSLTAALFRTVKTDARTTGIDPDGPPQVLDGEQWVEGIELGAYGYITEHWTVFGGFSYMNSEIENSNNANELGMELGLTPQTTFNMWTTYELPMGLAFGGGAQFMDAVFRNSSNSSSVPSYWLFNGMVSYEVNENLTLRLNISNLADEEYPDRVGGGHYIPGPGRTARLSASIRF